jgi:hypothetical protein
MRIDPDGMLDDGYTIDDKGNIERVDNTGGDDYDVLYKKSEYDKGNKSYDYEGVNTAGIRIDNTSVLESLSSEGKPIVEVWGTDFQTGEALTDTHTLNSATSKNGNEMMNLFVFAAKNSKKAEWRLHKEKSGTYNLSTLHDLQTSASDGDLGVSTSQVRWMIHSHPRPGPGQEVAGFDSDQGASKSYPGGFYVYTPKSGYIWKFKVSQGNIYRRQSNGKPEVFRNYVK